MDGQAGDLADDVPERDVDDADRHRIDVPAHPVHPRPVDTDVERVLADEERLDEPDDLLGDRRRSRARRADEAVALDPLVRPDPQDAHRQPAVADAEHLQDVRPTVVEDDADVCDAHGLPVAQRRSTIDPIATATTIRAPWTMPR